MWSLSNNAVIARRLWAGEPHVTLSTMVTKMKLVKHKTITRANGTPKGIIATVSNNQGIRFIYYPQKEHFEIFDRANSRVKIAGACHWFHGSVGSILTHMQQISGKNFLVVKDIQGHFKQGEPAELTRSLATKYGGWRNRLLTETFIKAESLGLPVAFRIFGYFDEEAKRELLRAQIFTQMAEDRGYGVRKLANFLIAEK